MPRKRFTNEQIAFALHQAENGATLDEVCRKMCVFEPTFNRWKKQFVGMGVPEIQRLEHAKMIEREPMGSRHVSQRLPACWKRISAESSRESIG